MKTEKLIEYESDRRSNSVSRGSEKLIDEWRVSYKDKWWKRDFDILRDDLVISEPWLEFKNVEGEWVKLSDITLKSATRFLMMS